MSRTGCKVCRVLEGRNMEQYEDELLDRWQADPPRRMGYRRLATWLNVTILRREMERAGLPTLGEEAESKYQRLRRGDAVAEEVAEGLARAGIDVERLTGDFVSYGVVRTHLKDCLGAEREAETGASEWERDTIDITEASARERFTEAVRSLHNKGELDAGGEIRVHVRPTVECENCETEVALDRAMRRGYLCGCNQP